MPPHSALDLPTLREATRRAALEAGAIAAAFFRAGAPTSARIWSKAGGSPVTEADIAADDHLKAACAKTMPEAAWLSEETADDPARLHSELVWVVDPIDGTRAFMSGSRDWCVCVALMRGGRPVLGVVHAPALEATYEAVLGAGATLNGAPICASGAASLEGARIAGPKPMLDAFARHAPIAPQPKVPSLALRLARIAEGRLDGGLISPDSRDWDLVAASLILEEAGGKLTLTDGRPLVFNAERPMHPTLLASNGALHPALVKAAAAARARFSSR